jgi:hypothetical protein
MAKGYVAGFIKYDGRWVGDWIQVDQHRRPRFDTLQDASVDLHHHLQAYAMGPTITGRKVVVIDALCPDGRELLDLIFTAVREHNDARSNS